MILYDMMIQYCNIISLQYFSVFSSTDWGSSTTHRNLGGSGSLRIPCEHQATRRVMSITTICNAKIEWSQSVCVCVHVYVYLSCLSSLHILWCRAALQRLRLHSFLTFFEHEQLVHSEVNTGQYESCHIVSSLDLFFSHLFIGSDACGTSVSTSGPQGDLAKSLGCHFLSQLRSGWMHCENMINHRKTIQTEFPTIMSVFIFYIIVSTVSLFVKRLLSLWILPLFCV